MEILKRFRLRMAAAALIIAATVTIAGTGAWALTPANTVIGNSATATYTDTDNNSYTTTSNLVQTVVTAVCFVDVTPDAGVSTTGVPSQTVNLSFFVQNTGNAEFDYKVEVNGTYVKNVYHDADGNGIADPGETKLSSWDGAASTITSLLTLGINESAAVVVTVTVPTSAANGATDPFTLTATENVLAACTDNSAGTVTITTDASIIANKAVDNQVTSPGATLTYNIAFKNVGLKAAKGQDGYSVDLDGSGTIAAPENSAEGILVKDTVPAGSKFTVGDSASGAPSTNPKGYPVYSTDGTNWYKTAADVIALPGTVSYVGFFMEDSAPADTTLQDVLAADQQGFLTFTVTVDSPFTEGDGCIDNTATVGYSTSVPASKTTTTNTTKSCVPPALAADISLGGLGGWSYGTSWTTAAVNPAAEEDGDPTDDNYINNYPTGTWMVFKHQVSNNGSSNDIINLEAGSKSDSWLTNAAIVEFWNAAGSAKLIDNSGDGKVDVGTVLGTNTKDFIVKVFWPANTAVVTLDGTVDYWLEIKASSVNDPTETDLSRDNIDGTVPASVDIADNGLAGDGVNDPSDGDIDGAADSDDIIPAVAIDPGATATYRVQVVNTGGSTDSYDLSRTGALPTNSLVKFFRDADCNGTPEAEISNTGLLGGARVVDDGVFVNTATDFIVSSVASFSNGDELIVGLDGAKHTITAIDAVTNKITIGTPVAGGAPSVGDEVSETKCLIMTVATGTTAAAGTFNMVVTSTSPTSGATNSIDAALTINQVCFISLTPDASDQLPANGSTTYNHTLTNLGNSSQVITVQIVLVGAHELTYSMLADTDTDGTDEIYSTGAYDGAGQGFQVTLAAGASFVFKVGVQAPSIVPLNTIEYIDVDALAAGGCSSSVTDVTTIIEGYLLLEKWVKNVTGGGAWLKSNTADPGDVVAYRVQFTNIGSLTAKNVVVSDQIPAFTTFAGDFAVDGADFCLDLDNDGACDTQYTKAVGGPDDQAEYDAANNLVRFRVGAGASTAAGGTLAPGENGSIIFQVIVQ